MLLEDQDRALWNTTQIAEGRASSTGRSPWAARALRPAGRDRPLHAETPRDWAQIAALYDELTRLTASPVVELNRAMAVAETEGPEAGLRIVDALGLDDYRYLHSTRAELLRRLGHTEEARAAYRRARELTDDGAERRFLDRRLAELAGTTRFRLDRRSVWKERRCSSKARSRGSRGSFHHVEPEVGGARCLDRTRLPQFDPSGRDPRRAGCRRRVGWG